MKKSFWSKLGFLMMVFFLSVIILQNYPPNNQVVFAATSDLTIHCKKPANWSNVNIYYYSENATVPNWPGTKMTSEGNDWYTYTITGLSSTKVIFNNGSGNQIPTSGQAGFNVTSESWYKDGKMYTQNPEQVAPTSMTINSSASTTVGESIALTSTVNYSDGSKKQEDLNWSVSDSTLASLSSNSGTTVNLTALKKGTVTVTASKGILTVQKTININDVSTSSIKVYFKSPWSPAKIYYWSTVPTVTAASWPGVDMTSEGNGWYSYTFNGVTSTNLIFNNGSGSKTADLSRTSGTWYYSNNVWSDKDPRTVTNEPVVPTSMTINSSASTTVGESIALTSTVNYSDGSKKQEDLNWSVSDSTLASLSSNSGTTVNLTALKKGTVTVTASKGTLTVQKTITINDVSTSSIKVYFKSPWSTAKIYYWSTVPTVTAASWPGIDMTSEGNGWYSYTFNGATSTNLIFNNGSGSKTADLSRTSGTWYYSNNAWSDKDPRGDTLAPTITASPNLGKVEQTSLDITLTAKDNVDTSPKVYYTTDGTDPIVGNNLYTGSIKLTKNTTIKAIAVDNSANNSTIYSFNYILGQDVKPPTVIVVSNVTLNNTSLNLGKGNTSKLIATISPSNASNKAVAWTTSDSNVATVDADGNVTAVGEGSATITCTASDGSGQSATCAVTVTNPINVINVTSVTLNSTSLNLEKGNTSTLIVTVNPDTASNKGVTWSSSDANVATVDNNGKVKAVGTGTSTITCSVSDGSGKSTTCAVIVRATSNITDESKFKFNSSTGTITHYFGPDRNVVIPSTINGIPVTRIGDYAFENCGIFTVTIPYGVTSIGEGAFCNCYPLARVDIPNSVTSIGAIAFLGCDFTFYSITIPDSVTSIGEDAFHGCGKLEHINVSDNNNNYTTVDGILFNKSKTKIIKYPSIEYPSINDKESYRIPDSVTCIESGAFNNCRSLKSIEIPNSVISIGGWAFDDCENLKNIEIPNSITSIGEWVFAGCDASSIIIPDSITSIGKYAFEDCSNLTSINIPDSVTSIGEDAFEDCSNLTSITIPNSVTSIGENAFKNTKKAIFYVDSEKMKQFLIDYGIVESRIVLLVNPSPTYPINESSFEFDASTGKITGYNGSNTKAVIPSTIKGQKVKGIGYHAFYNCSGLISIYILDNVTSIDANAFEGYNAIFYVDSDRVKQLLISSGVSEDKIIIKEDTSNDSLFVDTDFDLNPEVQQLISYYDDLYLYADVAYDEGIIKKYEYEALKAQCEQEVQKYRQQNEVDSDLISKEDQSTLVDLGLSFIPYIGLALGNSTETGADDTLDAQATKKILDPDNFSVISAALVIKSKFDFKYTIYELVDESTGEVRYVGRTRQSIDARSSQHSATDPDKKSLKIQKAAKNGSYLDNLSYQEARGLEQIVYDEDRLAAENVGKKLLNRIRPIRYGETITEDILAGKVIEGKSVEYIRAALKYLGRIK